MTLRNGFRSAHEFPDRVEAIEHKTSVAELGVGRNGRGARI
jgi:hypothetical protein